MRRSALRTRIRRFAWLAPLLALAVVVARAQPQPIGLIVAVR